MQDLQSKLADAHASILNRDEKIKMLSDQVTTLKSVVATKNHVIAEMKALDRCIKHRDFGVQTVSVISHEVSAQTETNSVEARNGEQESAAETVPISVLPQNEGKKSMGRHASLDRGAAPSTGSRVLLLADHLGKGAAQIIRKSLCPAFDTVSIFKPNASLEQVMQDVKSLTKAFSRNDFVFVVAGANNVLSNSYTDFRFINSKLLQMNHTNIIISSVPYCRSNENLNNRIYDFNRRLYENIQKIKKDLLYVDVNGLISQNSMASNGVQLTGSGKMILFEHLCRSIFNFKPNLNTFVNFDNIIEVTCSDTFSRAAPGMCGSASFTANDVVLGGGDDVDRQHVTCELVDADETQFFRH